MKWKLSKFVVYFKQLEHLGTDSSVHVGYLPVSDNRVIVQCKTFYEILFNRLEVDGRTLSYHNTFRFVKTGE